jgi:hypothetical protein
MANIWEWPPPQSALSTLQTIYATAPGMVSLSVPPALRGQVPSPNDVEFDSDPGWRYWDFGLPGVRAFSGTPNWDARIAGASPAISFTQRKSFVTLQPGNNSVSIFEACYIAPTPLAWVANTVKWYWCGHAVGWEYIQDYRHALAIFCTSAGNPDRPNSAFVGNIDTGGGMSPISTYSYSANVLSGPTGGPGAGAPITASAHWPYLGFALRTSGALAGTSIDWWLFNDEGQRVRIASGSFPQMTATYYPGFYIRSAATGSGGGVAPATGYQPGIFQADFLRELTGPTPPWARG